MSVKRRAGSAATRISSRVTSKHAASISTSASQTRSTSPADDQVETPSGDDDEAYVSDPNPPPKKRKTGNAAKQEAARLHQRLFSHDASGQDSERTCSLPKRLHSVTYHRPLLLQRPSRLGKEAQESLLSWFDSVSTARSMPWRKAWINPDDVADKDELRSMLEKRAYQVWISEIMLQQTRVAVVIDYWNRWMDKWPTIHDLAAANADDVLAAWKGLGYYSRATRIHQAAKHVVGHPKLKGLLPEDAKTLEAEVPGVGRYTAGAVSSIVFGRPEPMVDGNVLRVLSRQLGILGNVKADKSVIDVLWAAADTLVKDVAMGDKDYKPDDGADLPRNNRPGRWGQGLMELGSTICTPKPNCSACPITSTCRAYQEGQANAPAMSKPTSPVTDIEDACTLCEPFENVGDEGEGSNGAEANSKAKPVPAKPQKKQATLASFAFTRQSNGNSKPFAKTETEDKPSIEAIVNHARKFPLKVAKKAVREEETLVCAIRHEDGSYLIHRRPEKGLLAGLWELPSCTLEATEAASMDQRKRAAQDYVHGLFKDSNPDDLQYIGELGNVPWLFSHLKLTMHVHVFELLSGVDGSPSKAGGQQPRRWTKDAGEESMGTGMQKCWTLVKNDGAIRYK